MKHSRLVSALALCAAAVSTLGSAASLTAQASPAPIVEEVSPIRITAPAKVNGYWYDGNVELNLRRPGDRPGRAVRDLVEPHVATTSRSTPSGVSSGGTVALPDDTMTDFTGLPELHAASTIRNADGKLLAPSSAMSASTATASERISPEAPIRSPYPYGCPYNRFTRGSVMGVQEGWATRLDLYGDAASSWAKGTYAASAFVTRKYRDAVRDQPCRRPAHFTLVVGRRQRLPWLPRALTPTGQRYVVRPGRHGTDQPCAGEPVGPLPDLRSLPAFGIRVSRERQLPPVLRQRLERRRQPAGRSTGSGAPDEDVMDAYQYFVDEDGNQIGYEQVGTMKWDDTDSHQHWHFTDFARYRLLNEDRTAVVRSRRRRSAWPTPTRWTTPCRAPTGSRTNTDLHTSCGDFDSLSLREVLSSGSGDTYAQYRAGQSFDLRACPTASTSSPSRPTRTATWSSPTPTNNVALRKVTIGGVSGARTVKVGGWPAP